MILEKQTSNVDIGSQFLEQLTAKSLKNKKVGLLKRISTDRYIIVQRESLR